jgi:hypothetical protein
MNRASIFEKIYKNGTWNDKIINIPKSGPGSSIENTTKYRELLDMLCDTLHITSIVDLGCGDLTWIPHTTAFKNCKYIGIDIVKSLIDNHSEKYKQHTFMCLDATSDVIPEGDMVIVRDILFHLTFEEVNNVLNNIKGKFKYYLITSSNNISNSDTFNSYHFHNLNIRIPPFNIKNYQVVLQEPKFNRDILLFDHQFLFQ